MCRMNGVTINKTVSKMVLVQFLRLVQILCRLLPQLDEKTLRILTVKRVD